MVGMDVRLQNPFDAQPLGLNRFGDGIGGVRPYPSGGGNIVEHRIDDRARLRRRIGDKVAKGFGHLFEEGDNTAPPVRKPRGFREPRGLSRLSTENSLFAVFEPANMFLAVELDAELFDELQLRFQKIDVLFFID